ncbi:MAG: MerR family transcriptional regulator, redox-sensitive transcriptional activator SoxR [Gaiellales bacterium]|nr:MerR family transcriptional regulator, redox-sensitive transcriptional activator SoxR [Gaiellales bacterium]
MTEPAAMLTIGQVAARSGVAPSALRFYEAEGLISSERSDGNQRRYARAVLRRVAVIQAGRAAGIPLASIREALSVLPADKPPSQRDWARLSKAWRDDVEARIALLERVRDDLASCIGCGCLSLRSCRLFNPVDRAAEAGPGARYLLADRPRVA